MEFKPERLTAIRIAKGITRAEAARLLNMSAMGYGRYEKGERTPSFQTVSYIAQVFNTTTDFLYGLSDEESTSTITISFSDDPDLFMLIETVQANRDMIPRLLAYAEKMRDLPFSMMS